MSNQITYLNVRYYCHSLCQAKRAYDHLHQQMDNNIEDSVAAANDIVIYDDPLNLEIPYIFLLESLPEPPDGALKLMILLTLIIFEYFYPVVSGLVLHWPRPIFDSFLAKDNRNVFVRHIRRSHAK